MKTCKRHQCALPCTKCRDIAHHAKLRSDAARYRRLRNVDIEIPLEAKRCIKLANKHDVGDFYNRLADFMLLAAKLEVEVNRLRKLQREGNGNAD